MEIAAGIYYFIGSLVCHQIPQRTIYINGLLLPVCARDTGIYAGMFISFLFCLIRKRMDSDKPPQPGISIILALLMIPLMADGISTYMLLRQTDNVTRLITGLFFGMPIPLFLVPAANFKIYAVNSKNVVKNWSELVLLISINILACVLIINAVVPWFLVSTVFIISLVAIIGRLVFTLLKRAGILKQKIWFLQVASATLIIFCFMFLISNYLIEPLRNLIILLLF
ncbi:MAG: DUF2085 domain-containing protein [Bacillota bacterium]